MSKSNKEIVVFITKELKQETPTDIILKKLEYLNKLEILKKLFVKNRLIVEDPLWRNIENKSRLHRLFKRYERDYYMDPSQTWFAKLKRKWKSLPSQQKAMDLLGNLYSKTEALEQKCIRLIEKIYKDVKGNVINLPDGIKYYRNTKVLYIPDIPDININIQRQQKSEPTYEYVTKSKSLTLRIIAGLAISATVASAIFSLLYPVEKRLEDLRRLYQQLSQIELTTFVQKKTKFVKKL